RGCGGRGGVDGDEPRARLAVADAVEARVRRGGVQVRRDRAARFESLGILVEAEEDVLHDVARVVVVAQHAARAAQDRMTVLAIDVVERLRHGGVTAMRSGSASAIGASW